MAKDKRYQNVKDLIAAGSIKTIKDIFDSKAISKLKVYKDLGLNNARFNEVIDNVELFKLEDLFHLSLLIEIDAMKVLELAYNQWKQKNSKLEKRRHK